MSIMERDMQNYYNAGEDYLKEQADFLKQKLKEEEKERVKELYAFVSDTSEDYYGNTSPSPYSVDNKMIKLWPFLNEEE